MRLFFALTPDEALRAALAARGHALMQTLGGRSVPAHNLHLTLAFVGEVEHERATALPAMLDVLPRTPFTLVLDRVGAWRHAGVAWIAPSVVPAPLVALHSVLAEALRKGGFDVEGRPFRPHVTLVRRPSLQRADASTAPLEWTVERVALVRSQAEQGFVRYRDIASVVLDGRSSAA